MRFTLLVLAAPDLGAGNGHALRFARAALDGGHAIELVFFQDAGVLTGLAGCEAPQAEVDLRLAWSDLGTRHDLPLVTCSASAARFGVDDGRDLSRLMPGFSVAGLGELVAARACCDRLLTFTP
jgi:tRNA 2-thiouridine synthesizing protein D